MWSPLLFIETTSACNCSFLCLDAKERTKGKIKAGEEMSINFSAELKQIKHVSFPNESGDEYLFLTLRSEISLTPFFLRPISEQQ